MSPPRSFDPDLLLAQPIVTNSRPASADLSPFRPSTLQWALPPRSLCREAELRMVPVPPHHRRSREDGGESAVQSRTPESVVDGANASDHRHLEEAVRHLRSVWTMIRLESLNWLPHESRQVALSAIALDEAPSCRRERVPVESVRN